MTLSATAMRMFLAAAVVLAPYAASAVSQAGLVDAQTALVGAPTVYTRAIVQSISEEDGGKRIYIRLKLLPRAKIPFSTLTYRVLDRSLIAGLHQCASVAFHAQRIEGENTLTGIRTATPCERFKKCE